MPSSPQPGVGKTTAATEFGYRVDEQFPHGQLSYNLGGSTRTPAAPGDVLRHFLQVLGVENPPEREQQLANLFRSKTHDRRMLIVLDDADTMGQVRALLPNSPSCKVVVTSRKLALALVANRLGSVGGSQLAALKRGPLRLPLLDRRPCPSLRRTGCRAPGRRLVLEASDRTGQGDLRPAWVGEIFKRVDPVLDGENAQQLAFAKFSIEATNMLAAVLVATTWAPTT